jgi:hypothetical protein
MDLKRLATLTGLATALSIALSLGDPAAWAYPTDNTPDSGQDSFTTSHLCSDPVRVDSAWDIIIHTYYDQAGNAVRLAFTGTTRITYTDLANGNSYSPNSSGPGTIDLTTGESWVRGSNAAVFNPDGVLVATSGRIVYDANGNIVSIVGTQRPVCAELGAQDI